MTPEHGGPGPPSAFEQTLDRVRAALERTGLSVSRGFDLMHALAELPEECHCPHHGTARCTCQYAVLLVRAGAPAPSDLVAVVLHHRDGITWVSLQAPYGRVSDLARAVRRTLEEVRLEEAMEVLDG